MKVLDYYVTKLKFIMIRYVGNKNAGWAVDAVNVLIMISDECK